MTKEKWATIKYFKPSEFGKRGEEMAFKLVSKLDKVRAKFGRPIIITDGMREPGGIGVAGSAHEKGLAVDIRCNNSRFRYLLLDHFLWYGVNRIGIYNQHLHIDMDEGKDKRVIWLGTSK